MYKVSCQSRPCKADYPISLLPHIRVQVTLQLTVGRSVSQSSVRLSVEPLLGLMTRCSCAVKPLRGSIVMGRPP